MGRRGGRDAEPAGLQPRCDLDQVLQGGFRAREIIQDLEEGPALLAVVFVEAVQALGGCKVLQPLDLVLGRRKAREHLPGKFRMAIVIGRAVHASTVHRAWDDAPCFPCLEAIAAWGGALDVQHATQKRPHAAAKLPGVLGTENIWVGRDGHLLVGVQLQASAGGIDHRVWDPREDPGDITWSVSPGTRQPLPNTPNNGPCSRKR